MALITTEEGTIKVPSLFFYLLLRRFFMTLSYLKRLCISTSMCNTAVGFLFSL
jgi:hypothetical protein